MSSTWKISYYFSALGLLTFFENNYYERWTHAYSIKQWHHVAQLYQIWSDTSLPAIFNPLCNSTNQQLFEKNLCNQSKNYRQFLLRIEAYHKLTLITASHGTQRRALVSPQRMHCMYSGMAKGTSQDETTKKSKPVCSLSHCWIMLVWRHHIGS